MTDPFFVSIYHDTRRAKKNNLFPVKIRVFNSLVDKAKFYPTIFDLSQEDFKRAFGEAKPRGEVYRDLRLKLQSLESKAIEIARTVKPFSFENFEKKFLHGAGSQGDVFGYYDTAITTYTGNGQIGTRNSYKLSKASIESFIESIKGKKQQKLSFYEISPDWLNKYEKYMIGKGRTATTVGIYLRALRAIFNSAISDKLIDSDAYPFGKKKYVIPAGRNIKKALDNSDLKILFNSNAQNAEQEKAKDFWFFSYSCNGVNIKDILNLKKSNIDKKSITFYRAKTINTSKNDLRPISVYITDFAEHVIKKYGSTAKDSTEYLFPILNEGMNEEEKHRVIQNFTRFVNQNLKKLALSIGVTGEISTYYARHSYATNAVRNGASMAFVQEALGHGDSKTTMNYFKGFEDDDKKELMEKLMDFQ